MAGKKTSASFNFPVKFEARVPDFEPLSSLGSLNFAAFAKGTHKIEVGFMKGSCCKNLVRAVVKNGMVTGVEVDGCKPAPKSQSAELGKIADQARKSLFGTSKPPKFTPFPVSEIASARGLGYIITGGGCILICNRWFCIICCIWPPRCSSVDIIVGPLD